MMDADTLESLSTLAVPAVKTTIENWLVPSLEKLHKARLLTKGSTPDQISKTFEEYLLRSYSKLSFMNTIVFGNQQKRIQDLYIPLTVLSTCKESHEFLIEGWREDFVPLFKRVVITDTAGMGKSTLLKWLFLCSLGMSKSVPIFIELRTLTSERTILDCIYEELCPIDKPFDRELLLHLIKSGNFIFYLDGFDEVTFEDRRKVTEDIQGFIAKAIHNQFILASRHESALSSFGEFREFTIKPLSKNEAYTLLRRYDETREHAEALISELEASKYKQLKELMANPMLVSLLYKAYSYKPKIPFKKQIFYRQVFDALFDMHDSTKGGAFVRKKNCSLDIDEFHLVMRDIGFTTAKLGKIEYEKDVILALIKKVRERNQNILFQPASLLTDLVTTVPLFNREGEHYKWAHKSVQDYFASQYIALDAKGNENTILERIYSGGHCRRFENILDLLHDTDTKAFRKVLLHNVLRDFVAHFDSTYNSPFPGVSHEEIELRKQLTFGGDWAIGIMPDFDIVSADPKTFSTKLRSVLPKKFKHEVVMFFHIAEKMILLAFAAGPSSGLLPLLISKGYSYVTKPPNKIPRNPSKAVFEALQRVTILTDNPSSPLNQPECFQFINSIVAHHGTLISIDTARRTLKTLEEESNDEANIDQMLADL